MIPSGQYRPTGIQGRQMNTMVPGAATTTGPQMDTGPQMPAGATPAGPSAAQIAARNRIHAQAQAGAGINPAKIIPATNPLGGSSTGANSGQMSGQGGGYQGQINGIDPVKVNISPDILNSFQQYGDAAYQQAQRRLDPQWKQQDADFEQQMVGRGFSPGTAAYDAAKANLDRGRSDDYANARAQSLAQGLAAQGQAFGQGQAQSQLANELQKSKWGLEAANAGAAASEYSSALNRDVNMAQLGWDKDKFGQTFGAGQDQTDFQNLMQLFGAGQGTQQYNNSLLGADQGRMQQLMQMFNPQQQGSQNIDTQTPYNNQYNAQMNSAQARQQQQQAQQQSYAQMASMLAMMFA